MNTLSKIQSEIKAPKGQFNKFGGYKFRSCEDIVEAAKPVLNKYGFSLLLSDEILMIGTRFYIRSTASITNGDERYSAEAYAREDDQIKGMAVSQITGAASSYARKYALNGLFAIDDTKDADATNNHEDEPMEFITDDQRAELFRLLESSTYDEKQKTQGRLLITGYSKPEQYQTTKAKLLANQAGIDGAVNPGAKELNNHLRKVTKQPV